MLGLNKYIVSFFVVLSFSSAVEAAFETNLSDIHVQSILQNYFPVREYATIARVTLEEPKVLLEKNNKNIILMIPVNANIIGDALHQGHVRVLVNLSYKSSSGGLYLNNPVMNQFEMPTVDKKMMVELSEFIKTILKNSLPLVQIYKLKERDLNHSLSKSALKQSQIEDGRVKVVFGFK